MTKQKKSMVTVLIIQLEREADFSQTALDNKRKLINKLKKQLGVNTDVK